MKLTNVTFAYGKLFTVKVGEITIPRYLTVGAIIAVVIVISLKHFDIFS